MSVPTYKMLESTRLTLGWVEMMSRRADHPDEAYLVNYVWRLAVKYMEQEVGDAKEE